MTTLGVRRSMVVALAVAAATSAFAADPEPAVLVGWPTWGSSSAKAAEGLARWNAEHGLLAKLVTVQPGFPRIVTRADVPSLEPDEYAIALGFCRPGEEQPALDIISALQPGTYALRVSGARAGLSCPRPLDGWRLDSRTYVKSGSFALDGAALVRKFPDGASEALVHLYLRDRDDALVDSKEIALARGCTAVLSTDAEAIVVERRCAGTAPGAAGLQRFAVRDGKIGAAAGLGEMADVQVVVWGGGKSEADAKAALARWEQERPAMGEAVALAPGYPRMVASAELPGLNPGYHVVVLGLCPAARLEKPMAALKRFSPGVYAKAVKPAGGDPGCPTVPEGWAVAHAEQVRVRSFDLTVVELKGAEIPWRVRAWLRDGKGTLLDWKEADMKSVSENGQGSCVGITLVKRKDGIALDLDCGAPGGGPIPLYWRQLLTYSVRDGKIVTRGKTL